MKRDISKIKTQRARFQKNVDRLWSQINSISAGPERDKKLQEFLALGDKKGILPNLESLEEFGKFLDRQPITMATMKAACNGILPDDAWQKSYDEGYQYVVEFCNYEPNLPAPPDPQNDPKTGFRSLQKWYVEALKYRSKDRLAKSQRKSRGGAKRKRDTQKIPKKRLRRVSRKI